MTRERIKKGYPRAVGKPRTPAARSREIERRLVEIYPVAICELTHANAFELLAATILSAQCTDVRVNMVTPALFKKYPTPKKLAAANVADVEELVRSTGFFQTKARNLVGMAHVGRLSRRLGLTTEEDPVKVERVLNDFLPPEQWGGFGLRLILHGRRVCDAKKPKCDICELEDICPSTLMPTRKKTK